MTNSDVRTVIEMINDEYSAMYPGFSITAEINLSDMNYKFKISLGSVSILDFAPHSVIASEDPKGLYDHLVKFIKEVNNA